LSSNPRQTHLLICKYFSQSVQFKW